VLNSFKGWYSTLCYQSPIESERNFLEMLLEIMSGFYLQSQIVQPLHLRTGKNRP